MIPSPLSNLSDELIHELIEEWLQLESKGMEFPVDFNVAWQVAGYATKASAKRKLSKFAEGSDFSTDLLKNGRRGRSSDSIQMSCDAFKHFCLLAETEQGQQIRQYFIECEKKWRLVQQNHPEVAKEVDRLRELELELELAKAQAQKALAEKSVLDTRHLIVVTCPEAIQQKILGYQSVVEYRDRIVHNNELLNDGTTITKTELCHRYGLITKNGSPDYRQLNRLLANNPIPQEAWEKKARIQDVPELKRSYLSELDKIFNASDRQRYLGEGS